MSRVNNLLYNIIYNNFLINLYYSNQRKKVLQSDFLSSSKYDDYFFKYNSETQPVETFKDDAELSTKNFRYRHFKVNKILGSWRWKGIWQHKNEIIPVVFNKTGIDFGGAYGPISYQATVVDFSKKDIFGRKVVYHSLEEIDFRVDYVFSSHTLEHIPEIENTIKKIHEMLFPNGTLILNLPSYTCTRWRSGIHTHKTFNDHAWTFHLSGSQVDKEIKNLLPVDQLIEKYFEVLKKEYTGDNSIYIYARK